MERILHRLEFINVEVGGIGGRRKTAARLQAMCPGGAGLFPSTVSRWGFGRDVLGSAASRHGFGRRLLSRCLMYISEGSVSLACAGCFAGASANTPLDHLKLWVFRCRCTVDCIKTTVDAQWTHSGRTVDCIKTYTSVISRLEIKNALNERICEFERAIALAYAGARAGA